MKLTRFIHFDSQPFRFARSDAVIDPQRPQSSTRKYTSSTVPATRACSDKHLESQAFGS